MGPVGVFSRNVATVGSSAKGLDLLSGEGWKELGVVVGSAACCMDSLGNDSSGDNATRARTFGALSTVGGVGLVPKSEILLRGNSIFRGRCLRVGGYNSVGNNEVRISTCNRKSTLPYVGTGNDKV